MKLSKSLSLVIILLLCLTSAVWAKGSSDAEAVKAIEANLADYGNFMIEGDFEKWGELHSENVIKMFPNAPPTLNRQEMVARADKRKGMVKVISFDVDIQETEVNGDNAHAWGLYTVKMQPLAGGEPIMVDGKFLTLYHKEKDGQWLITHDCFNSNVPPDM